jgi:hypothetical protein
MWACADCKHKFVPLEAEKQEPYAFEASMYSSERLKIDPVTGDVSIVTPQREWVGLTLDERLDLAQDVDWAIGAYCDYAQNVENKLKEKNT